MNDLAVCDTKTQGIIQNFAGDTLDTMIQTDNTSQILNSEMYQKLTNEIGAFIMSGVTHQYEANFHNSLNVFEKCGFISKNKIASYERKHSMLQAGVPIAVSAVANVIPLLAQSIDAKRQQSNMESFFFGWTGYINQTGDITPLMVRNMRQILDSLQLNKSDEDIKIALRGYNTTSQYLPSLSKKNKSTLNGIERGQLIALSKKVVSTADLKVPDIKDRSLEFICDMFDVTYSDGQTLLEDILASQEYLTTVLNFSSIDYMTFFQPFAKSVKDAIQLSQYDVSMDVYAQQRLHNKKVVTDVGKKVLTSGAKAFITENPAYLLELMKPTQDIIMVSESLMSKTLNQQMDAHKGFELMYAQMEQRKFCNIPPVRK